MSIEENENVKEAKNKRDEYIKDFLSNKTIDKNGVVYVKSYDPNRNFLEQYIEARIKNERS